MNIETRLLNLYLDIYNKRDYYVAIGKVEMAKDLELINEEFYVRMINILEKTKLENDNFDFMNLKNFYIEDFFIYKKDICAFNIEYKIDGNYGRIITDIKRFEFHWELFEYDISVDTIEALTKNNEPYLLLNCTYNGSDKNIIKFNKEF